MRHKCSECAHRVTIDEELWCPEYKVWRRPDSMQITPVAWNDKLCDFKPKPIDLGSKRLMDFDKALKISGKFQEAYDTLFRTYGQNLEEKASPYIGMIKHVMGREKCSSVEAVLIILKNWNNSKRIPMTALTLWLLASAVILEKEEIRV